MKIAITGNIASGKSQAEKIIAEIYNYPVFDADKIAHLILDEIDDFYGYDVFTNGKIDRKKLGQLVFNESNIKHKLEDMVHPKVKEKILELFEKHKDDKYIFVSVPLLYEAGFENLFDKVILITVNEDIQLQRLMARNNLSKEDAIQRIKSQIPQEEKIKKADFVITNNASIEILKKQIEKMCKSFI